MKNRIINRTFWPQSNVTKYQTALRLGIQETWVLASYRMKNMFIFLSLCVHHLAWTGTFWPVKWPRSSGLTIRETDAGFHAKNLNLDSYRCVFNTCIHRQKHWWYEWMDDFVWSTPATLTVVEAWSFFLILWDVKKQSQWLGRARWVL